MNFKYSDEQVGCGAWGSTPEGAVDKSIGKMKQRIESLGDSDWEKRDSTGGPMSPQSRFLGAIDRATKERKRLTYGSRKKRKFA